MTAPTTPSTQRAVQPQATAGNDLNSNIAIVQQDSTITSVTYTPVTTIAGANTNTRSVSLVNKKADGSGTTVIATLQFNSGVNATAAVQKAITLSATASDLNVSAGDVLQWQSTHIGTGIADPGGLVAIGMSAKYA